jgi:hypothetical protein
MNKLQFQCINRAIHPDQDTAAAYNTFDFASAVAFDGYPR